MFILFYYKYKTTLTDETLPQTTIIAGKKPEAAKVWCDGTGREFVRVLATSRGIKRLEEIRKTCNTVISLTLSAYDPRYGEPCGT